MRPTTQQVVHPTTCSLHWRHTEPPPEVGWYPVKLRHHPFPSECGLFSWWDGTGWSEAFSRWTTLKDLLARLEKYESLGAFPRDMFAWCLPPEEWIPAQISKIEPHHLERYPHAVAEVALNPNARQDTRNWAEGVILNSKNQLRLLKTLLPAKKSDDPPIPQDALRFTKERPTKFGLYYFRYSKTSPVDIAHVFVTPTIGLWVETFRLCKHTSASTLWASCPVDSHLLDGGSWAGPLPTPHD